MFIALFQLKGFLNSNCIMFTRVVVAVFHYSSNRRRMSNHIMIANSIMMSIASPHWMIPSSILSMAGNIIVASSNSWASAYDPFSRRPTGGSRAICNVSSGTTNMALMRTIWYIRGISRSRVVTNMSFSSYLSNWGVLGDMMRSSNLMNWGVVRHMMGPTHFMNR